MIGVCRGRSTIGMGCSLNVRNLGAVVGSYELAERGEGPIPRAGSVAVETGL